LVGVGKLASWYILRVITLNTAGGQAEWKTCREVISCPSAGSEGGSASNISRLSSQSTMRVFLRPRVQNGHRSFAYLLHELKDNLGATADLLKSCFSLSLNSWKLIIFP